MDQSLILTLHRQKQRAVRPSKGPVPLIFNGRNDPGRRRIRHTKNLQITHYHIISPSPAIPFLFLITSHLILPRPLPLSPSRAFPLPPTHIPLPHISPHIFPAPPRLLFRPPSRIQTRSAHRYLGRVFCGLTYRCAQTGAGAGLDAGWGTHLAAGWGTWVFQFPENNVIILWGTGRTERG